MLSLMKGDDFRRSLTSPHPIRGDSSQLRLEREREEGEEEKRREVSERERERKALRRSGRNVGCDSRFWIPLSKQQVKKKKFPFFLEKKKNFFFWKRGEERSWLWRS